mgnify:CR=1 FL=1
MATDTQHATTQTAEFKPWELEERLIMIDRLEMAHVGRAPAYIDADLWMEEVREKWSKMSLQDLASALERITGKNLRKTIMIDMIMTDLVDYFTSRKAAAEAKVKATATADAKATAILTEEQMTPERVIEFRRALWVHRFNKLKNIIDLIRLEMSKPPTDRDQLMWIFNLINDWSRMDTNHLKLLRENHSLDDYPSRIFPYSYRQVMRRQSN